MLSRVPKSYAATLCGARAGSAPLTPTLFQAQHGSHAMGNGNTPTTSRRSSAKPSTSLKFPNSPASGVSFSPTRMLKYSKASQPESSRCITGSGQPKPEQISPGGDSSEQLASCAATSYRNQSCNTTTPESVLSPDDTDADIQNGEVSQHEGAPTSAPEDSLRRPDLPPSNTPLSHRGPQPISLTKEEYEEYSRRTFRKDRIAWGS